MSPQANPQTRTMGAGRDLFGVRKDGTEIPVEIGLNPIETDEGLFVLASVVDISARKQAEEELRLNRVWTATFAEGLPEEAARAFTDALVGSGGAA